jgi:hypothetical protein
MNKIVVLVLFVISSTGVFAQNNLTPDQIRRYANELGVPYEALQRLVDSHRIQTGQSQQPIIIQDMADFEFTPGYNVPGTLFQADYYWSDQNGQTLYLRPNLLLGTGAHNFQGATQRFNFKRDDPVTVVFKVKQYPSSYSFDFVSIEKK